MRCKGPKVGIRWHVRGMKGDLCGLNVLREGGMVEDEVGERPGHQEG